MPMIRVGIIWLRDCRCPSSLATEIDEPRAVRMRHRPYRLTRCCLPAAFGIASVAWCALSHGAAGAATDWPMFRGGPSLLGVAQGSLPAQPALLWSFKTDGPIKSSPSVVGGRGYVGSGDQQVYCLDFATGQKIWSFKTQGEVESSPLLLDGRV